VSSDPFSDLGRGVGYFADALRALLDGNQGPVPGSPACIEADGEPYAGDWGPHPSRDIFATMMITAWSAADHLAGMAAVLRTERGIASLYTLARSATEAAVVGCYLSEVGVSPLERVRRNMNCNLDGICQDLNMLRRFDSPDTRQRTARHRAQLDAIKRTGQQHGWAFTAQKRARSAYLGDEAPRTMTLIDQCASRTQGLGAVSYQMLSGVAHARLHGLSNLLMTSPAAQPGKVQVQMNIAPDVLGQQLLVGPLCATTLVEHLRWFLGWDTEKVDPAANRMDAIWGRIAHVPVLGPRLL
jgi:hypothetical protein